MATNSGDETVNRTTTAADQPCIACGQLLGSIMLWVGLNGPYHPRCLPESGGLRSTEET